VQYSEDPDAFDRLPVAEKEVFAHKFADKLKKELTDKGVIPFPRQFFESSFRQSDLEPGDFLEHP
jgi:hypothetical protein